jgi:hypothetical protein
VRKNVGRPTLWSGGHVFGDMGRMICQPLHSCYDYWNGERLYVGHGFNGRASFSVLANLMPHAITFYMTLAAYLLSAIQ